LKSKLENQSIAMTSREAEIAALKQEKSQMREESDRVETELRQERDKA